MKNTTPLAMIGMVLVAGCLVTSASGKPSPSSDKAPVQTAQRSAPAHQPFPYDPLCPWGRLSNGRGFVVRCLSREEAEGLGSKTQEDPKPAAAETAPAVVSDAALTPGKKSDPVEIELGPITADTGAFPQGVASLNKGMEKYLACVAEHGGIQKAEAEVQVRFLVSGRGRAEGCTVKKRQGIGDQAAKCIADVVDRRFVGYPDAELVGATLVVKIKKK